jgi:hypothetical protein
MSLLLALWLLGAPGTASGRNPVPPPNPCDVAEETEERRAAHEEAFA